MVVDVKEVASELNYHSCQCYWAGIEELDETWGDEESVVLLTALHEDELDAVLDQHAAVSDTAGDEDAPCLRVAFGMQTDPALHQVSHAAADSDALKVVSGRSHRKSESCKLVVGAVVVEEMRAVALDRKDEGT